MSRFRNQYRLGGLLLWIVLYLIGVSGNSAASMIAAAEVPRGFEIIELIQSDNNYSSPKLNDCGEIVFSIGGGGVADVYHYDNGVLTQITWDQSSVRPDINSQGTIAYTTNYVPDAHDGEIVVYGDGELSVLGTGVYPRINDLGHVVWEKAFWGDCAYRVDVWFFDGTTSYELFSNQLSNQSLALNNHDEVVWTSYDFCHAPWPWWVSEILLYRDGKVMAMPSASDTPQLANIDDTGRVAWSISPQAYVRLIEMFIDDRLVTFPEPGLLSALNNQGDILFGRFFVEPHGVWEKYLYRAAEGRSYRLTSGNPAVWNTSGDLNEHAEAVWLWSQNPNWTSDFYPWGVRHLRRIRNGDLDNDGVIGPDDFAPWVDCLTGPGDFARLCDCRFEDMEFDRDVDLGDFARFMNTYDRPQYPGEGCCEAHHHPGCNDGDIEACVCAILPFCCTIEWDEFCVYLVELLDCGACEE